MKIVEGPYLRDLLDQPAALRETLASLSEEPELLSLVSHLHSGKLRRIVLTGMGSSYHALYPLHLALTANGHCSLWVETSELIHYLTEALGPETLVVALSQSGESAETLGLLQVCRGQVPLIAVTNNPASRLANQASVRILMHAGLELGVSCKTYLASLLLLEWLSCILTGQDRAIARKDLATAASMVELYLQPWERNVAALRQMVGGVRQVFIAGRGPSLAATGTGGLILKESARFSAEGMSSAAFRHGPIESVDNSVLVVVMEGDRRSEILNRRLARDVHAAGGRTALVEMHDTPGPFHIPTAVERIRPILEILPVQMLSLALAALTGNEPGTFKLATKITTTE